MDTHINLRAFVDELVRCGMRTAVTSPGSRNSPLVLALARDRRLGVESVIDERCAGFFALGAAKASALPVAVTCTSGTAAANLLPAVIEAHEARVPLIVLTADRPPELRDVGAGQAIDQVKLFGSAAKWYLEVDEQPASDERVRWLRQLACRAFWTALRGRPGPVHINWSLREPLVPGGPVPEPPPGRPDGRPWITEWNVNRPRDEQRCSGRRPVVVAGRWERDARLPVELAEACAAAGVPLLADPLSGARRGPAAIAHYDLLLRSERFAAEHRPDLVIRVGDLPTSKPLRAWLAGCDAVQIAVDPESAWQDPTASVTHIAGALPDLPAGEEGWLAGWHAADRQAAGAIAQTLGPHGLTEPRLAAELGSWLPAGATLVVSSSMPIRDIETYTPARPDPPRVLANRGANGIDGVVSTAYGVKAVTEGPVVCLIGDVALAHDIGGLLAATRQDLEVTFVLVNNDGGGIFHFLPVAGEDPEYTRHVATPHGLDFAKAAALYGLEHVLAATPEEFRTAVSGSRIVEVRTDRAANRALHQAVADSVRACL